MSLKTPIIIGSVVSGVMILIFVWLISASQGESNLGNVSDVLDIQAFRKNLSIISQKEKNGDLPIKFKSDQLERDDPFGGL